MLSLIRRRRASLRPSAAAMRLFSSLARDSLTLAFSSSAVRTSTRLSSWTLCCWISVSLWRCSVMSVYSVMKPWCGNGSPRRRSTRPFGRTRSVVCGANVAARATRSLTWRSMSPGPYSPCSALWRIKLSNVAPTNANSGGKPNSRKKGAFHATRRRSASNTVSPWSSKSSPACSIVKRSRSACGCSVMSIQQSRRVSDRRLQSFVTFLQ